MLDLRRCVQIQAKPESAHRDAPQHYLVARVREVWKGIQSGHVLAGPHQSYAREYETRVRTVRQAF